MSRRFRKSGLTITLFSFQDIIMSTSGVMMMIVLILSLELIERTERAAVAAPRSIESLEEAITKFETEISNLKNQIAHEESFFQRSNELSPLEMETITRGLVTANQLMSEQESQIRQQISQLQKKRQTTQQSNADLQNKITDAQKRLRALQTQIQSGQRNARSYFSLPENETRQGWLVDVAKSKIQVAPIGTPAKPLAFGDGTENASAEEGFLDWARSLSSARSLYLFLFVRPEGQREFESLSRRLDLMRIAYGFDVLGADEVLFDPERGAAE